MSVLEQEGRVHNQCPHLKGHELTLLDLASHVHTVSLPSGPTSLIRIGPLTFQPPLPLHPHRLHSSPLGCEKRVFGARACITYAH